MLSISDRRNRFNALMCLLGQILSAVNVINRSVSVDPSFGKACKPSLAPGGDNATLNALQLH